MLKSIIILSLLFVSPAYALSCTHPPKVVSYITYPLIFHGEAIRTEWVIEDTGPKNFNDLAQRKDSYTEFKIIEVFKGDANETIKVYHNRKSIVLNDVSYESGKKYKIFAAWDKKLNAYATGYCDPIIRY